VGEKQPTKRRRRCGGHWSITKNFEEHQLTMNAWKTNKWRRVGGGAEYDIVRREEE
jgi:hypothetical protein